MRDIFEEELRGPSVVRSYEPLTFEYVPEALPNREDAERELIRIFKPLLSTPAGQHAIVRGPVGSGKTVLTKHFARGFHDAAKGQGVAVEHVHVNCRRHSTEDGALLQIIQRFDPNFPDRGFSVAEKIDTLRKRLARREAHLIVILDEADVLLKKSGSDLVYNLTRFNEGATNPRQAVCVILVSTQDVRGLLDEATASTFKRGNVVDLQGYDEDGLLDIVRQRVALAFQPGTVREEVMGFVAEVAAPTGDARRAIELLQKAAEAADGEGSDHLTPEHVRAAHADIDVFTLESKLRDLARQKQLVLLAIARVFRGNEEPYTITGDAEERYALVCEEFDEEPRAHTQFWTYLKDLEAEGFLDTRPSGKGIQGTTTLISLQDLPARELAGKLEEILGRGDAA